MTVKELREMLKKADPNDLVLTWDPDSEDWETVTGMVYGGRDGIVKLYTDET